MSALLTIPKPLQSFFALFPLHTYPPIPTLSHVPSHTPTSATIWVHPPHPASQHSLLSSDVECLKWQAFLALRGLKSIRVRFDVKSDGGVDGRLPCLHVPTPLVDPSVPIKEKNGDEWSARVGEVLPAHLIPEWVDKTLATEATEGQVEEKLLEGYKDIEAKDESRAWVALLEGTVHSALLTLTPPPLLSLLSLAPQRNPPSHSTLITPPPPPFTGFSSLLPPYGTKVSIEDIETKYIDAIGALSERLAGDRWFLGSQNPTPLDALLFAYLHTILNTPIPPPSSSPLSSSSPKARAKSAVLRIQITRRVNLVAWEKRVRALVSAAFVPAE
ncbi:hypothetical protein JAAARDRAFT_124489 [Jaapia argillacea MUCL 33604]|uniref:Metaxin glutathione S-transferase domain-containing protein n=1 Tax=Jaapia argillacea MUCL 33604 TaxID=933084 RepID=A0A067QE87_9AGAM|nr:hypothetical protein JAAARDRAFT_124489 [Jaapia argillacea MUCL 33604]